MKRPHTLKHTDRRKAARREAAAAWLVRLEAPEAKEADWLAFEQWLPDAANKRALDEVDAVLAIVEDHRDALRTPGRKRPSIGLRSGFFVGLAAVAGGFLIVELRPAPLQTLQYEAPANAMRAIALPDGTNMTLNRGAAAQVQWSAAVRRVTLERGEAAFRVVHNESAPFAVESGVASISDLGTEFNVLRRPSGLTVTVRNGSVSVSSHAGVQSLSAGDQASIENTQMTVRRIDPDDAFAWREGRLIYRNAPLSDIVADLNRYSATPIRVDPAAGALRFSGVLIIGSPEAMTASLEAFLPVRSEHNAGGIVIRSR